MRILSDWRDMSIMIFFTITKRKIHFEKPAKFSHISKVSLQNVKLNGAKSEFCEVTGLCTSWIKCILKKLTVFFI